MAKAKNNTKTNNANVNNASKIEMKEHKTATQKAAAKAEPRELSELQKARIAKKAAGDTFCGIVKSLYGYSETEEGKFLRSYLPKDKKAFLKRGEEVCKWGKVGETKTTKKSSYLIKISADIVLRFINNENKQKAAEAKAAKKNGKK